MRIESTEDGGVQVTLSRRNLLALLTKLDGHPPDSKCTIGYGLLRVHAEEDHVHYNDRPPGRMIPETEAAMRELIKNDPYSQ